MSILFSINVVDFVALFLLFSGFIVGLGAVTVIDLHGFLGRTSTYWTEATIRTHKVTKPLIWIGMSLATIGGCLFYRNQGFSVPAQIHAILALILLTNGSFLSFRVSPFLLQREQEGQAAVCLPENWQRKIFVSFLISFFGWWSALALFLVVLLERS